MPSDRELYGGATDAELREIRSLYASGDWPAIEERLIREIVGLRRKLALASGLIEDYAAMCSRNCLETPSELAEALASMREPRYTEYDPEGLR